MENKSLTAVEWLIQNILEDQAIKAKSMSEWIEVFEQAKAMEKEQTERMYNEEDLEEAFKAGREGDMVFNNESPKYWDFNEWFEHFKKK
jgi:hypothetical protein